MSVTLTWIGHATWLIDTGGGVLLIDPFLDDCPTASLKAKDVECDAILVTHAHADPMVDGVVTCPWHAWRFRLCDGAWCDNPKLTVDVFETRVAGDTVEVRVPPPRTVEIPESV